MNVKLLKKIKKHILAEPRRLYMAEGLICGIPKTRAAVDDLSTYNEPAPILPACGTVGCIAGWAYMLSNRKHVGPTDTTWGNVSRKAQALLDLRGEPPEWPEVLNEQAKKLFRVEAWPTKFCTKYQKAKMAKTRASITAARIDHFIATKGAE